jgi:hypothetical protein
MTLAEQAREDFLQVDMVETVTYYPRRSDDGFGEGVFTTALFRPPSKRHGSPDVTGVDGVFHLDAIPLERVMVSTGGRIEQANGRRWLVKSLSLESWQTRWRAEVVREVC